MRILRVGVVGAGYWGPNLIRNFVALEGVEVAWVCDRDPHRLAVVARAFRVGATTSRYSDLLEDRSLDAIVLATPVATHRTLGQAALEENKHLWVEKPLARSIADALALVELARARERCLLVDHTFVYAPALTHIRSLVEAGALGEILYLDSVRVNLGLFREDVSVLWDLGPHDLAIARSVLGQNPTHVSAIAFRGLQGEHASMAYVTLRYAAGAVAHFHESWLSPVKVRRTMIGGTRRMILYDDLDLLQKVRVFARGVDPQAPDDASRRRALVSYRSGDLSCPMLDEDEPLAIAARDFVAAIRTQRKPLSDGESGLDVVRVLETADRSLAQEGRLLDLL